MKVNLLLVTLEQESIVTSTERMEFSEMSTVNTVNGPRECRVKPSKDKYIMTLRETLVWGSPECKEDILMELHRLGDISLQCRDEAIERIRANGCKESK